MSDFDTFKANAIELLGMSDSCINGYQHLSTEDLIAQAQVNATLALACAVANDGGPTA
ncbi:hypothetical protein ACH47B_13070 [Rhodococcus sp. NPDC019627]|uniref:hypothetical protein n=1 Tax=unclassified Rhodococcus (in: high G+C Gram-positive bacteria) TaxID=192944 RepID=UPI0033C0EB29